MRIIIKEPGKRGRIAEISGSLKSMQETVGGLIQTIPLEWLACINKSDLYCETLKGKDFIVVMDEEGKLMYKPINLLMKGVDAVVGTCFICKQQDEEMVGLEPDEAETILGLLGD